MNPTGRRASVIATLSLLAWAATASAECARVLWHAMTAFGWGQAGFLRRLKASV